MLKKRKKGIALLLVVVLMLSAVACGKTENAEPTGSDNTTSDSATMETSKSAYPVTVTDAAGREVTFEEQPKDILTVYGMNYVLALGLGDNLINGSDDAFAQKVAPNVAEGVTFGSDQMNAETIAELDPDVFIHRADSVEIMDALDELGIKSVGIQMETPEQVVSTLEFLGKTLGVQDRAQELIDYYEDLMRVGTDLTKDVPEEDKPTAILMGNTIGKVANSTMLQSIMMESAGGVNLAADIESEETWPTVGTEQIFEWDPDYIFIMNHRSREYDVEDILNDPAWADLTAVKNGHVYVVPSDLDSWEFPGVQSALGTIWMTNKMYPELMSDDQLEDYVNEFYDFVYNVSFTREELNY